MGAPPMHVDLYCFQPLATNSMRVFLALLEKGVPFVSREMAGPDFDHLKPAYLAINPKGQVPTLVCDGRVLTEGMLINEFIDEAFDGPALRPADPRGRYVMRSWCDYAENDIGRALMMVNWNRVVPSLAGGRSEAEMARLLEAVPDPDRRRSWLAAYRQTTPPEAIATARTRLEEGSRRIEARLSASRHVAGDAYTLADIDLMSFCGLMTDWTPELMNAQATPATMDWLARLEERPAVRESRARTTGLLA